MYARILNKQPSLHVLLFKLVRSRLVIKLLGSGILELAREEGVVVSDRNVGACDAHHAKVPLVLFLLCKFIDL